MQLHELAGQAYDAMETATRPDSDETYVRTKHDAPQWVNDLVHEAHGDMLPDDWRYESIRAALSHIHDTGAEDADSFDAAHEFADDNVDVYNGALCAWLASHAARAGYCNEAADEGLIGNDVDVLRIIGAGQYVESLEIIGSVLQSLQDRLDELAEELDAAERFGENDA